MNTLKILSEMGMGELFGDLVGSVKVFWSTLRSLEGDTERGRTEEVVAQVTELVLALGAEEEVTEAARADLAQMECAPPGDGGVGDGRVGWDEYRRTFVALSELLLRLAEDLGQGGEACAFVAEQVVGSDNGGWRDMEYLYRLWGDVVEAYLTRAAPQARWVIGGLEEEKGKCGWWVTEEASGLRFFLQPYDLEVGINPIVWLSWRAEMNYETPVHSLLHDALLRDLRPGLLGGAFQFLGMEAISEEELKKLPKEELSLLYSASLKRRAETKVDPKCYRSAFKPERAWEALCLGDLIEVIDRILYRS